METTEITKTYEKTRKPYLQLFNSTSLQLVSSTLTDLCLIYGDGMFQGSPLMTMVLPVIQDTLHLYRSVANSVRGQLIFGLLLLHFQGFNSSFNHSACFKAGQCRTTWFCLVLARSQPLLLPLEVSGRSCFLYRIFATRMVLTIF